MLAQTLAVFALVAVAQVVLLVKLADFLTASKSKDGHYIALAYVAQNDRHAG